jgi:conjugative relaxase-like TrwC/TraI family protein
MLSIKPLSQNDINKTVNYYADSVDDYYKTEGDVSGWFGKGSEYLNLKDEAEGQPQVEKEILKNLLLGQIPVGDDLQPQEISSRKFKRADQKDRMGFDLTFSAPKSLSLQTLVGGDAKLIGCHDRAVEAALLAAERYAQTRHKVKGVSRTITTGNLIVARFRHETSRARDPQLHTHCIVMNLTRRPDGEWRALKNDEIVKRVLFLGQVYRDTLAQELVKQGYKLRYDPDDRLAKEGLFELAHFTDSQIEAFSVRSQQVEAQLHKKGLTRESATSAHKQLATLQSRERKMSVNREELLKEWLQRAKELDIEFLPRGGFQKSSLEIKTLEPERALEGQDLCHLAEGRLPKDAEQSLKFAIRHLMERQAVISEKDLLNMALKHGVGMSRGEPTVGSEDIQEALQHFLKNGKLIKAHLTENSLHLSQKDPIKTQGQRLAPSRGSASDEKWYTTPRAIADEQLILRLEAMSRGTVRPIMEAGEAQRFLRDSSLTQEQQNAANMILTTQNRIVGIQGFAGVGKSHLLKHCSQLILQQGYEVEIIAPYNNQVKELKKLGVPSRTLISFLQSSRQSLHHQKVLVVDEAGLVPTRLMKKLSLQVEKHGGRLVYLGDIMQLPAIESGKPYAQLQKSGMTTLKLTNIQRQETKELKEAVNLAARGQAITSLDSIKNLTEIKSPQHRYNRMAKDYARLEPKIMAETMLLTGTNASRTLLNKQVRDQLGLSGKGQVVDVLRQRDMTEAEKAHAKYYRVGDVIKIEKDYKSLPLKRGEFYEVQKIENGNLIVKGGNNELLTFNPSRYRAVSTFEKERIELSPKDQVRFISQDKERGIERGDCFDVVAIHKDHILLKDKHRQVTLPAKGLLPLSYAYASTVHGSQGMTLHGVLLDLQTKSRTTDKNLYYVAVSRARYEVKIYTDDIQALPNVLSRETFKPSALDGLKKDQPVKELDEIEMER